MLFERRLLISGTALFLLTAAAGAQDMTIQAVPGQRLSERVLFGTEVNFGVPLASVLKEVNWEASTRGALLIIAPENTRRTMIRGANGKTLPKQPAEPTLGREGYNLSKLAGFYDRQLVPVGTVSVLMPNQMTLLNTNPGKGDPFGDLRGDEKAQLLFGSLTPAQFRLLATPNGLGLGDMKTTAQRELFQSLFSGEMTLMRMGAQGVRGAMEMTPQAVTPEQRRGIRLRMVRTPQVFVPIGPGSYSMLDPQLEAGQGGEYQLNMTSPGDFQQGAAFGVFLKSEVPSRLKETDIDYASSALDAPVSLDGVKTVKELVARCAMATGVELYADARYGALGVYVRGEKARCGDVLKALAYGLTGTYRKVGPDDQGKNVFILTDDLEGYGTRRARIQAWGQGLQETRNRTMQEMREHIAEASQGVTPTVETAPGFDLPTDFVQKVEEAGTKAGASPTRGMVGVPISASSLPPAYQAMLAKKAEERQYRSLFSFGGAPEGLPGEGQVGVRFQTQTQLILPGIGAVRLNGGSLNILDGMLGNLRVLTPATITPVDTSPVSLPASVIGRSLVVAPTSRGEIEKIVAAGKGRINQLWVVVPEKDGVALLTEAVALGKANGIAVFAVVRLLHTGEGAETDGLYDTAMTGESARLVADQRKNGVAAKTYWQRIDQPTTPILLKRKVLEVASVPGLAGLVLRDTVAPGYAMKPMANLPGFLPQGQGDDFGYSVPLRLQMIRQGSCDPVDLPGNSTLSTDLNLPFMSEARAMMRIENGVLLPETGGLSLKQQWEQLRYERNLQVMKELYAAIRAEKPELLLVMGERVRLSWYGSWDVPEKLPESRLFFGMGETRKTSFQLAKEQSRMIFYTVPLSTLSPGNRDVKRVASALRAWSNSMGKSKEDWQNVTLDGSGLPVDDVVALLPALEVQVTR